MPRRSKAREPKYPKYLGGRDHTRKILASGVWPTPLLNPYQRGYDAGGIAAQRLEIVLIIEVACRGRIMGFRDRRRILERTARGRADAKAKGVKFGRKPKLTTHRQREAIKRRDMDGETLRSIALTYNVSPQTISQLTA